MEEARSKAKMTAESLTNSSSTSPRNATKKHDWYDGDIKPVVPEIAWKNGDKEYPSTIRNEPWTKKRIPPYWSHTTCMEELDHARVCVGTHLHCNDCFNNAVFLETFPSYVQDYFMQESKRNRCHASQKLYCEKFDPYLNGEASCCCVKENLNYIDCVQKYFDLEHNFPNCLNIENLSENLDVEEAWFETSCRHLRELEKEHRTWNIVGAVGMSIAAIFSVALYFYRKHFANKLQPLSSRYEPVSIELTPNTSKIIIGSDSNAKEGGGVIRRRSLGSFVDDSSS